ncbi:MerR family transcriptional regulator [Thiomicrorhabdus sp. Milos-T2]|uniref:MerR family transcriptional regulator n=1 Tax=Thiomicrorhabdus sp. Milos-T2 TaxID=90814 RepID=UPI000689A4DE|nr:MerR family transcriptional regulator [Thiomicrorhabdus sp. Milos-T2]
MKNQEALYPIREVSNLTGVNSITLRAWERRYGLIEPVRTEGGHRLYTMEHIERIKGAVKLTEQGIPISQVKSRLTQVAVKEKEMVNQDDYDYLSKLKEACTAFDLETLNLELDHAFMDVSDALLYGIFIEISHQLKGDEGTANNVLLAFWESQLLPRLHTRLRFASRHIAMHSAKILWLLPESEDDLRSSLIIAAIRLAQKGFVCIINSEPTHNDALLFERVKISKSQGVVVVDTQKGFDESRWTNWVETHPGLELHYFSELAENTDLSKEIQCYAYNI